MSLAFATPIPGDLLIHFKKLIDQKHVVTWAHNRDGDFTHTPDQWRGKAWLRPSIQGGQLTFSILRPHGAVVSSVVYAVYHGRFIEAMLTHCDRYFSTCSATALATSIDSVAA